MKEVKKDEFRSQGQSLRDDYDMYRVVLDVSKNEYYYYLKTLLERSDNSDSTKCKVKKPTKLEYPDGGYDD